LSSVPSARDVIADGRHELDDGVVPQFEVRDRRVTMP